MRKTKNKYKFWKSVNILLGIILVIIICGMIDKNQQLDVLAASQASLLAQNQELSNQVTQLSQDDKTMEILASKIVDDNKPWTLEREKQVIDTIMPNRTDANRFFKIISTCENGTLDPNRINWNTNGSYDIGLAQINSGYDHRQQVEKMFGLPFDVAMKDGVKNLVYATKMYKDWGNNFNAWVCSKLVK